MTRLVKDLWAGRLPLGQAVWWYAVVYGLLVNLATHALFFALLVKDAGAVPVMAAFALPVPYNVFMVVAVWRSAARYQGSQTWADFARFGTVLWMIALTAV